MASPLPRRRGPAHRVLPGRCSLAASRYARASPPALAGRSFRTNGSSARPSPAGLLLRLPWRACPRHHNAPSQPRQGPSARPRSASVGITAPACERINQGALESVLLLAARPTAACLGGATTSLAAVSWRTARADPHSQAVGIVRLRHPRRRPRQLALHADWRADRADRRRRGPVGDRRVAHRRHQDPQGRQPRPLALRLRRPPRPAGRPLLAVEVHPMPSRGLCRVGVRRPAFCLLSGLRAISGSA
jgi:hypothetical protein